MYYYLLSELLHRDKEAQENDPKYPHAKKNILIFLIGSVAYLFTAGFLWSKQYQPLVQSVLPLSIIKDFFLWFMAVDIITCFALFKVFWGFSLTKEINGIVGDKKTKNETTIEESNIVNQSEEEKQEPDSAEEAPPLSNIS